MSTRQSADSGSGATNSESARLTADALSEALAAPEDVFGAPGDAEFTDSGLASRVLEEGQGQRFPRPQDEVQVHYTGWQTDGMRFDSSVERGTPSTFFLNRVIAGWTEGLQLMVEGEQRRFWIPEDLAYGGAPGRPMGMLVFDVELIQIIGG